jgi:hypothetical protein
MNKYILSFVLLVSAVVQAEDSISANLDGFFLKPGIYDSGLEPGTCSWKVDQYADKLTLTPVNRYNGVKCLSTDSVNLSSCESSDGGRSISCCGNPYGKNYCKFIFRAYKPDIINAQGNGPQYDLGLLRWVANSSPAPSIFKNNVQNGWTFENFRTAYCKFPNGTRIECDKLDLPLVEPLCEGLEERAVDAATLACRGEGFARCSLVSVTHKVILKEAASGITNWTGCRAEAKVSGRK